MTMLPPLLDKGRGRGLAAVATLNLVQGAAAGAAAFATRDLFSAMHQRIPLQTADLAVLVGAGAAIAATRIGARLLGERIGQEYVRDIRVALFRQTAAMPARVAAGRRTGHTVLRFVGDMTAFRNWLALGLPRLIAAAILVPVMLAVLWLLNPLFALVVLPVLGLALLVSVWEGVRLLPLQRRLRRRRARIAADMAERLPIAPQLDRLGRRGKEQTLLEKRTGAMISTALRYRSHVEWIKALPDLAAGIAAAALIATAYRKGLGASDIAAALAALGLLLTPLRDLGAVWNHHAAHKVASRNVTRALSADPRAVYRAGRSLPKRPVDVAVEGVALPSGTLLSFHARAGETKEIPVDERDSEWLADVLLGLETAGTGQIRLAGIDVADLSRGTLRRHVLDCGRAPTILQGSLRRALSMGCDRRPGDRRLEALAREAGLGPLLGRLGGLDGTVLERGKNLTRDEQAGIALVRHRLASPRVIIAHADDPDSKAELGPTSFADPGVTVVSFRRNGGRR
ncbi:ABC transporter ATP-binding protein [uncultured Paracoccus sp.]|uniref:ABC transporter ATP-binding protein n=1 Tax=uncultured Paracoccus sp. TaxID=189685 RepID=UPI0025FB4ACB|nr:ABC transporter ATP-binding protein [uncultured Paracoccus sp.]